MGPRCRRGTDATDCAVDALGVRLDVLKHPARPGTYATDDSCIFANNGVCDELASGESHVYRRCRAAAWVARSSPTIRSPTSLVWSAPVRPPQIRCARRIAGRT